MTRTEEKDWIRGVVADLRGRYDAAGSPERRGPVPLERFLAEQALRLVELPALSRAAVYDYLLAQGTLPPDMGADEKLAGFLYLSGPFGRVFVNADDPVPRRRFTAAHELGHYLLHRDQMSGTRFHDDTETMMEADEEQVSDMERQANRFAVELLMPAATCTVRAAAFRQAYRICPFTPFAHHLAAELLVSLQAMRYRLEELEVCDGA
jgi:hypothetical protein